MTIQEQIAAAIEKAIAAHVDGAIAAALGEQPAAPVFPDGERKRRGEPTGEPQPATRRKREPGTGNRATYVVNVSKRGAQPKMAHLFPTAEKVWDVVRRHKRGLTAFEVEQLTGLKKKTVESCLWYLRSEGMIRSEYR
jgi:hypothetical protein